MSDWNLSDISNTWSLVQPALIFSSNYIKISFISRYELKDLKISHFDFSGKTLLNHHSCRICKKEPISVDRAIVMMENNDSYIEFMGQAWLLCQLCEEYIHFNCYCAKMCISKIQKPAEQEYFREGQAYVCSKCRITRDGSYWVNFSFYHPSYR